MRIARRALLATLALVVLSATVAGFEFWHQGYRIYILHTGSMTPTYPTGAVVIDRPADRGYRVGEVITFQHSEGTSDVVTHRITKIQPSGLINTKGDANRTADVWNIHPSQVQGSVMFGVKDVGYALVFFRQPTGIGALACAIFSLALLWGIFFPSAPQTDVESESAAETDGERKHQPAHAAVGAPQHA